MNWTITGTPGFAVLNIDLNSGELFYAQPKSMLCMSTGIKIKAKLGGSDKSGLKIINAIKGTLAGENFFITEYLSTRDNEHLSIAPAAIGPIFEIQMKERVPLMIAKGSYLANSNGVVLETVYAGIKGFLAKKGIFLLKAYGDGNIFISAHGDILIKDLKEGEKIAIDNDYVLAFDSTVKYELVTVTKGLKDSYFSGEGLVNRYTGPGSVYCQTRSKIRSGIISTAISTFT